MIAENIIDWAAAEFPHAAKCIRETDNVPAWLVYFRTEVFLGLDRESFRAPKKFHRRPTL